MTQSKRKIHKIFYKAHLFLKCGFTKKQIEKLSDKELKELYFKNI